MYLFDTNVCIRILNNTSARLVSRLRAENPSAIRLSSITKGELLFGARHARRGRRLVSRENPARWQQRVLDSVPRSLSEAAFQ